ncbi:hypothetical protein L9F63_015234 [Diploptera punctata]|uniref:Uncharacterized protein n=1 Tax=Diploptera punctata TaxID=6984 RepID=A0AAD8A6S2_DIPPU|nr:hypothetical protein L9F63_015234 [Diploptera punctata]
MLIGLVMYISIFKAEIGSKLRPRSQLQPPFFTYRYGFSFLLIVSGFMATEIAGTCAIFLYIYWHQKEWGRKRHEHHLHRRKLSSSSMLLNVDHHNPTSLFPCRRHPHSYQQPYPGRPPHLRASPQRRFYLEHRGPEVECHNSAEPSPCRHPAIPSFTGSMRDMTSSSYYSFPAPAGTLVDTGYHHYHHHHHDEECEATPRIADHHHHHHHHHLPHHPHHHGSARELSTSRSSFFPRDATTNTVSTTADINSCGDNDVEEEDYSPSIQHEHEFVTFDLDDNPPVPPVRAVATGTDELSPQQRRKDFGFDTLRRTTPV